MSFSYQFGANPPIDYPRFIVSDTQQFGDDGVTPIYAFEDSEILMAATIETSVFQSGMFYNQTGGLNQFQNGPTPWRRIGATLLDSLAANKARLSGILQVLDVKLSLSQAAKELRAQAQALREAEDNSGSFIIVEQTPNPFAFRDRWWATVQRNGVIG